jgi:hypothetical protein
MMPMAFFWWEEPDSRGLVMNRFWIVSAVALFLSATSLRAAPLGPAPVKAGPVKAAPRVEVEWGGSWSLAEVLQTRGDLSLIHYVGWDATWDEWVPPSRIRPVGTLESPPCCWHRCRP